MTSVCVILVCAILIQSSFPPLSLAFIKKNPTNLSSTKSAAPFWAESNRKCRNRARPIGVKMRDEIEFVTAPLSTTVKLECFYCNEADDSLTKIWYFRPSFTPNTNLAELKLATFSDPTRNRIFVKFDHTLVIKNVEASDAGLYECHGRRGEDAEYKFNYMVDVTSATIRTIVGTLDGWKNYSLEVYQKANAFYAENPPSEFQIIQGVDVAMRVVSEWSPWSNCDGCLKLRRRTAECKIKPEIARKYFPGFKAKRQNVPRYTTREIVDDTKRLTLNHHTVKIQLYSTTHKFEALEYVIPSKTDDQHLLILRSYEVSCHSLALQSIYPSISRNVSKISNYVISESCYSPCKLANSSISQPKYRNIITLEEGDHITLVCPEAGLGSKVTWTINGVKIKVHSFEIDTADDVFVDTFSNLHITYAKKEKSGNYTCFINDERIQEVIVHVNVKSVIQNAAFLRHMQYLSFMVLFGFIFYVAGVIIAWTQRHSFKRIDFSEEDGRRIQPNVYDHLIKSDDD